MIDEMAHAGPEHLDAAFIAGFDRKQGYPDPAEDIAAFEARGLGATSVIVDLGAGTGQFTLAAARHFGRVVAVDVSAPMLAATRSKAESLSAPLPGVEYARAGFLSYSPDVPADGVYTRHALHQLPDFWKAVALARIAAMLKPGGVLRLRDLVYDFEPAAAPAIFDRWLAAAAADPAQGYTAGDYAEHIRTEHSTFRWLLEPMLAAAGFEIADVAYDRRLYAAYTCVKARLGNRARRVAVVQVGRRGLDHDRARRPVRPLGQLATRRGAIRLRLAPGPPDRYPPLTWGTDSHSK
jgi:ubiquinone/menaquinone biosynthesis C-methylase UbiE